MRAKLGNTLKTKTAIVIISAIVAFALNEAIWKTTWPRVSAFFFDIYANYAPKPPADPDIVLVDLNELNQIPKYRSTNEGFLNLEGVTATVLKISEAKPIAVGFALVMFDFFNNTGNWAALWKAVESLPNEFSVDAGFSTTGTIKENISRLNVISGSVGWDFTTGARDRVSRRFVTKCRRIAETYSTLLDFLIEKKLKPGEISGTFERNNCSCVHAFFRSVGSYKRIKLAEILSGIAADQLKNKFVVLGNDDQFETDNYRLIPLHDQSPYYFTYMEAIANYIDSVGSGKVIKDATNKTSYYFSFVAIFLLLSSFLLLSPLRSLSTSFLILALQFILPFIVLIISDHLIDPARGVLASIMIQYFGVTTKFLISIRTHAKKELAHRLAIQQNKNIALASQADLGIKLAMKVAHDIRSPISAIQAVAGLLPKEGNQELIRILDDSSHRLMKTAESLLDRYRTKNLTSDLRFFHPTHSIESIINSAKLVWPKLSISLNLCPSPALAFDRIKFERCFSNILNNAIEATNGIGVIKIESSVSDKKFQVDVIDNGNGIANEIKDKLFVEGVTFGKSSGTGLGLTQAKTVLREFGGDISLERSDKTGTHFKMWLNLAAQTSNIVRVNQNVIIADDSDEIVGLLKSLLEDAGCTVTTHLKPETFLKIKNFDKDTTLIADLIFDGSDFNGLDLIEHFKNANMNEVLNPNQTILCTSLAESKAIQDISISNKFLLLNKGQLPHTRFVKAESPVSKLSFAKQNNKE